MASILDTTQIENAVISLSSQRLPITARRLAREALVSPATLYSVVSSVDAAIDLGQAAIAVEALPRLIAASRFGKVEPLVEWIAQDWGVAGIFFDPSRRGGVAQIPDQLEQHRSAIGAMMAFGSFSSEAELETSLRAVLAETQGCAGQPFADPCGASNQRDLISPDVLIRDVWAETRRIITESGHDVEVRTAAVDLLESAEPDGWTFRRVSELTGLPLVSVHRSGSRFEQINRAIRDVSAGLQSITDAWCDTPHDAVAMSFALTARAPGIRQALAEVTTRNLRTNAINSFENNARNASQRMQPETAAHVHVCIGWLLSHRQPQLQGSAA